MNKSRATTLDAVVTTTLRRLAGAKPRVVVAFSGGIDSTVLADALVRNRRELSSLRLVHVDHGLQTASADWARHCARQARAWRVPLSTLQVTVAQRRGESPEAAARDARYAALEAELKPGEVLVTAQHQDDQAETLLLQLFRGAGVAGLAAMPEVAPFGAGRITRPLLCVPRAGIERHARDRRLRWVDDPTNVETHFARNYLRAKVMPLIERQWPGATGAIARTARHMAEADRLLSGLAQRDLMKASDGADLDVALLRTLPRARRLNVLRAWIARFGLEAPSTAQTLQIGENLLAARADANPQVEWHGGVIRRRAGRLTLQVNSQVPAETTGELVSKSWHWRRQRQCILNRAGDSLELIDDAAGPLDLEALPARVEIRARVGGETLRPGPRARAKALKKLLQAAQLPVEVRARMPLVFAGERLLAAGDRWVDASVAAHDKSRRRARLIWRR